MRILGGVREGGGLYVRVGRGNEGNEANLKGRGGKKCELLSKKVKGRRAGLWWGGEGGLSGRK